MLLAIRITKFSSSQSRRRAPIRKLPSYLVFYGIFSRKLRILFIYKESLNIVRLSRHVPRHEVQSQIILPYFLVRNHLTLANIAGLVLHTYSIYFDLKTSYSSNGFVHLVVNVC